MLTKRIQRRCAIDRAQSRPAPLGAVAVVLACLLVAGCGQERAVEADRAEAPTSVEPVAEGPTLEDHWHAAYGVWLCDHFAEDLEDTDADLAGIHTHYDGLIHIHPYTESAAGANATLGLFADQVGLELDDEHLEMPSGETYAAGDHCGGVAGVVRVLEWPSASNEHEVTLHEADLRAVRLRDGAAYTIAFMDPDTVVEEVLPPTVVGIVGSRDELPVDEAGVPFLDPEDPGPGLERLCEELADLAGEPVSSEDVLMFHPVLSAVPTGMCDIEGLATDDQGMQYVLGPPLPAGMIERANARLEGPGEWVVNLVFNEGRPGIDDFNDFAKRCSPPSDQCPTGQVAVVVDGEVVSAPVIQATEFERDQIMVSGGFTEREARQLAARIG